MPAKVAEYIGQEKIADSSRSSSRPREQEGSARSRAALWAAGASGRRRSRTIIAREMGVNLRQTAGPCSSAQAPRRDPHQPRAEDVLFIDESTAWRRGRGNPLPRGRGLPDRHHDRRGPAARSVKLDLPPFTLVGATTRAGMLTNPFATRFGIVARLSSSTPRGSSSAIVNRSARLLKVEISPEGGLEIAKASRGTPRVVEPAASPRSADFAQVRAQGRSRARSRTPP